MSSEPPAAATSNTRTPNMSNSQPSNTSTSASGMVGTRTVKDLNAHEWSQAVIDELQHIQVATPPMKDINSTLQYISESSGDRKNIRASHSKRLVAQESGESTPQPLYNQKTNSHLGVPQRPQAEQMESTATIDIVKQIPGGW
ncbi:hypothetical protein TWF730_011352 [Orbilia blumenaviensis]|uniref:Uncharacterized protein n=1 Tax=Orbilia blumenaviensis TaxID=1796055 RepID=A0AAV9UNK1_9PEZI